MEFLKAEYTEVWVPSPVVPLIQFADRVRSIASTGIDLAGIPEIEAPWLDQFDSTISWYGTNRPEFRAVFEAEFYKALPPADGAVHCADFFAMQVGAPVPAIPRIKTPDRGPHDYAVIHPFSGSPRKNWPLEHYSELARHLHFPALFCAGPEEALEGAVRFDNLYDLACWLAASRVYIGNDSGITHLAAAAGARVLAIFGPTNPNVWAPRGEHVQVIHDDFKNISVERVLDSLALLLAS
jgi:ADP-heptose:LPS heptosyltransferase